MGNGLTTKEPVLDEKIQSQRIIWVDSQVNTSENNLLVQKQLRKRTTNLMTFDNQEKFYKYIMSTLSDDHILLITSGRLGLIIIPQIHHLQQIRSIYIYCMDKTCYILWAKTFSKVKI